MASKDEPLKLEADEVDFWKTIFLRQLDYLYKRSQSFFAAFSFSTIPGPGEMADHAVRDLRARKKIGPAKDLDAD